MPSKNSALNDVLITRNSTNRGCFSGRFEKNRADTPDRSSAGVNCPTSERTGVRLNTMMRSLWPLNQIASVKLPYASRLHSKMVSSLELNLKSEAIRQKEYIAKILPKKLLKSSTYVVLCSQSYTVKYIAIYSINNSCAKYGFTILQKIILSPL